MRLFSLLLGTVLAGALVTGCEREDDSFSPGETPAETTPEATAPDTADATPDTMTPGDVEAEVRIHASVAMPRPQNVAVSDMMGRYEHLNMQTVRITPPYPDELMADITFISERNFGEQPVAVRARVLRIGDDDEEVIERFSMVLGSQAVRRDYMDQSQMPQMEWQVDVLQGLDEIPESMLVTVEADVLLMPAGTDEETVDPETATASKVDTGILVSNPMRIEFLPPEEEQTIHQAEEAPASAGIDAPLPVPEIGEAAPDAAAESAPSEPAPAEEAAPAEESAQ